MRLTWPFTGRAGGMRRVEAALSDDETAGIAICGAAGVGKSRMAREVLDAAEAQGWQTRRVAGTACARGLPLGALSSWAESSDEDGLALVCSVIELLTAAPANTAVVIGVDDAHLLDDLSMFVVHEIIHRKAAKVLLTVRDDEPIPTAIQEFWKLEQFERLELEPLSDDDTAGLLSATLGGSVDPHTARALWGLTRGNALYLRHIVEHEIAEGRLTADNGYWRWSGEPVVPHSLVEMIESAIGMLPDEVGTVIDMLAVCEPIGLAALQRLTDPQAVEDADIHGLLRLDYLEHGIEVRAAHPLYSEVRRARAAPTRLRRLRGLAAKELAAAANADEMQVVVRRAMLSAESDLPPDPDLLIRGAQGAVCLGDLPLAERLAGIADHAGGGVEARFLRAHALSWVGRGADSEEVLAGIDVAGLTDDDLARLTYLRASNLLWGLNDPARAKRVIDEGGARAGTRSGRMCIDAISTVYWFAADRPDAALDTCTGVRLDDLPPIVGAETAWALASIHADAGRTADAVALAEAGYAIATRCLDAPHMRFNIADTHVSALVLAGRLDEAQEIASWASGQAADLPGTAHALGPAIAGRAALGAGCLESACSLLSQAVKALSANGHEGGWGYRYGIPRATALAMRGSKDEAAWVLAGLVDRPFRLLDYERSLAQAWAAPGQGASSEAVTIMRSAAERCSQEGRFAAEVLCLQTAVQFGDPSCEPRLRELEAIVEGPRVGLAARFAAAMRVSDADELASVSELFEAAGDRVAAVDAAAHASEAYRRQDLRGSALTWATRAEALAEECGADTPVLRQVREPLPLTDREREIALLVGQGLSNREIAERLTLSVRTVEGYVYKAMTKTGTTNRAELAALLRTPPRRTPPRDPS